MKDLILGFKLLRYGYKLKTNVMMLGLFTAIGLLIEISSHGTNILGGFYFMLTGMFAYQMIIYMNASDYVQSSAMKRKLEVGAMIFCGVCYKYFVASFIVFMLVIITCMSIVSAWLYHHHISDVISLGLVKLAVLGYAAILLGGVIEYLISSLLYRKQLSEIAMSGLSKSMK